MSADIPDLGDILSFRARRAVERRTFITVISSAVCPPGVQTWATWRFDPADPVAVSFTPDGSPTWTFARQLLSWGLYGQAPAAGDVHLWPSKQHRGRLVLLLRSPRGQATFDLDAVDVEAFLAATYRSVLPQDEMADVDWDALAAGWSS